MRDIKNIDELTIHDKHKKFICEFLKQACQITTFHKIDRLILFGSCARGNASIYSDVDIMVVGDGIGDETLFDLYDCAWYPGFENANNTVNNDIFVNDSAYFEKRSNVLGTLQYWIKKEGVVLNELL